MNNQTLDQLFHESDVILDQETEIPLKGHELLQQIRDSGESRSLSVARVEAEMYIAWLKTRAAQIEADRIQGEGEFNATLIEKKLTTLLRYVCDGLDIRFDEWNKDEKLACAIRNNPKMKMIYPGIFAHTYDSVVETAELLGVELDPKLLLFCGLNDLNKTIKVKVYDFKSKQETEMPLAELAPGYVKGKIAGKEGEYFVNAEDIKKRTTPIHGEFHAELKKKMEYLARVFHEVYPQTSLEWEQGFRCDQHPDNEIALWLMMAKHYLHHTGKRPMSIAAKKDYLNVILQTVTSGDKHVLALVELNEISRSEMKRVMNLIKKGLPNED